MTTSSPRSPRPSSKKSPTTAAPEGKKPEDAVSVDAEAMADRAPTAPTAEGTPDSRTPEDLTVEPPIAAENPTDEPPIPTQRAYGYWLILLFIVLAGSLISVSWYGWMLFQTNADRINHVLATQKADQNALSAALQNARTQLDQLKASTNTAAQNSDRKLNQLQTESQTAQDALKTRVDHLDHNFARIEDRLGRGELAWQVADIGFLLTRAEERLSIAHDPAGAEVALSLADQRLAALSRPEVLPVRSAISQALAQLQKVDAFDRVGAALQLRRAAAGVSQWPLIGSVLPASATQPSSAVPTQPAAVPGVIPSTEEPWYVRWPQAVWTPVADWFGRQFTISRSDAPVKASARARADRETLMWLMAVREALLAHDAQALQSTIQQADDWVSAHYDVQGHAVAETLAILKKTQTFYASQTLPDLAPIFKAWRASGLMAATTMPAPAATETYP